MRTKAPVYRDEGTAIASVEIGQLKEIAAELPDGELKSRLFAAIEKLIEVTQAHVAIKKGGLRVGFGVDKAQKAIACDSIIAIVRQIKSMPGW